ncbi:glycosyltransferase [Thermoflavifilum thermophilum]|uniref:Glycosyltransferase involved in cell wall bisynthesis n=1 Tax=Thermoflavifilum thermophilum TaxID=1393122 RepID=A0A1I7NBV7_9BACT|nr:glycosyltransferase [Thermoflavifilum thermophilum]SFV32036.1 Glycosyltransferase involved in cell wall bisynthesis [Thermoflavifilum thermophilum]
MESESVFLPRTPQEPPLITPLHDYPLRWSVMIPTHNCSAYLPKTLDSVLAQALPTHLMQVEVMDDASTDADVKSLVEQIGKGRISFYRQPCHVGSLHNLNTAIQRAKGEYIHILHGDDLVLPGFYEEMEKLFSAFPEAGMAFCRYLYIDENGHALYPAEPEADKAGLLTDWLSRIASRQRIQTPSVVVRRKVYEQIGGFYGVHYGEDWLMWIRITARFPVAYTPTIRAAYRQHQASISGRSALTGQDMHDIRKVIVWMKDWVPKDSYSACARQARQFYARYAIRTAYRLWHLKAGFKPTLNQLKQAFRLHPKALLSSHAIKLYLKILCQIH